MNDTSTTSVIPEVNRSTAWIYGSVSLPLAIISYPLGVWIPRLYSTEIGIDLGLIGLVIFSAAIFDAVSDPLMGSISDTFKSRWGRRHPFMYGAAIPYAVSFFLLFSPPDNLGQTQLFLWFSGVKM